MAISSSLCESRAYHGPPVLFSRARYRFRMSRFSAASWSGSYGRLFGLPMRMSATIVPASALAGGKRRVSRKQWHDASETIKAVQ